MGLYFELFFTVFFVSIKNAFWSNEIGKKCLSKIVQRIRNYSNLSFYNDWIGTYGVISISCDGIILRTFFLLFFFLSFTKAFWSNETGKGFFIKVVWRVRNYLYLSFYYDCKGTYGFIIIFFDCFFLRTFFLLFFIYFFF